MSVYEFEDKRKEGDIVSFEIWNAYDVIKYGGWFDTIMVCPICGNKFNLNSNTQRSTCDECYKKDFLRQI